MCPRLPMWRQPAHVAVAYAYPTFADVGKLLAMQEVVSSTVVSELQPDAPRSVMSASALAPVYIHVPSVSKPVAYRSHRASA